MPETSRMLDIAPGEYAKAYQKLARDHGVAVLPTILTALNKLDANEDPAKAKGLIDGVVAAIVKWDAAWSEEIKKVTDPKAKALRAEFAVGMFKLKQVVQGDVPPTSGGSDKAAPPAPYKQTSFAPELAKLRQRVPFGSAYALANLDAAKTLEEAKPHAEAAQKELEKEIADVDAIFKSTKDKDYKLKASEYASSLRSILRRVKDATK